MEDKVFADVASFESNPLWETHIKRDRPLYKRASDFRSPYERDCTRILHCLAYRRLKHKTQVFFNIENDHICTRMEHVQHVESVSCSIAKCLGLNTELTRAIAMGHDLGHAPFGHEGEVELSELRNENGMDRFWHERNSLRVIDKLDLLENSERDYDNLCLTYAVRDGIISHCGEVDQNGIKPRSEAIDLGVYSKAGEFQPFTWEGCVVKISDKIAYLGRDIEDAIRLKFISFPQIRQLARLSRKYNETTINTTVIMNKFIHSICTNSTPQKGILLSDSYNELLNEIKAFNSEYIYKNPKFAPYKIYVKTVIRALYDALICTYSGSDSFRLLAKQQHDYPVLVGDFTDFLNKYVEPDILGKQAVTVKRYKNEKIYGRLETRQVYAQAIIDFISGMTDRYAIELYNEILKY